MSNKRLTRYSIVSGWKRGGTSALMLALRQCGIPVVGHKFPFGYKTIEGKTNIDAGSFFPIEAKTREDNPTGYWEVASLIIADGLNEKWDGVGMDNDVIKIPLDSISRSKPEMVNKVIVILREPLKVLASQINANMLPDNKNKIRVSALGMIFIANNLFYWLVENKKEFYILFYEYLLKRPEKELKQACEWFGRGDYKWGARAIQKGLDRSKPLKRKYPELKEIDNFYKDIRDKHRCIQYDLVKLKKRIKKLDKYGYIRFNKK